MKTQRLFFILFWLFCVNSFSIEAQTNIFENNLSTLGGEPSAIVNGCVNAITGTYINFSTDMIIPGPEPILVQKSYTSSDGWRMLGEEHLYMDVESINSEFAHIKDGMCTRFKSYVVHEENFVYGLTNSGSGILSGQTNPKNQKIYHEGQVAYLVDGSGTKRTFKRSFDEPEFEFSSIQKPNRILTRINNTKNKLRLLKRTISNFNAANQELNKITIDSQEAKFDVYSNDQRKCEYNLTSSPDRRNRLLSVSRPNDSFQIFEYDSNKRMKAYILPDSRRQEIRYYNKGQNIVPGFPFTPFSVKKESDTLHGRVLSISEPVGTDANPIPIYRFIYNLEFHDGKVHKSKDFKNCIPINHNGSLKALKSGSTAVLDAYGKITHYTYDGHLRLTGINQYLEGNLYRQQNFLWGPIQHAEKGNLLYKTLSDAQGQIYSFIAYIYDSQGNVINEQLTGFLTGRNFSPIAKNPHGIPYSNGCDVFVKNYIYSQDGLNLILHENDGRKQISYSYHPGTNLLTAKLISDNGIIKCREFFQYDFNGQPTIQIKDDGCTTDQENLQGVSERHITRIQYRQTTPIGLSQIIEEYYLNLSENQEILLKKIENVHDLYGNLIQQKHYDSEGCERYSLFWEYNSHNKVIKEINAAGHVISYDYDQNDNLVFEQHPGNDYYTRHIYDFSNRLIRSENVLPHATHITHHSYNLLGQKVSTIDWYGQKTTYEYDECGRLKNITYPAIPDENGILYHSIEQISYDIANNPISKTDKRGFITRASYNIRGQPYRIEYPDGSIEKNEYALDGLLEKQVALNGTVTQNHFDYLGRPYQTIIQSPSGDLIQTSCIYNYFHKLQETDPAGHITHYTYDDAGRLASTIKEDTKTVYQYDSCQRISKILEYFGPNEKDYIVKVNEYDVLNQITEERHEDADGNVLSKINYVYNPRGERIQTISHHQSTPAITYTEYTSYGEIAKIIDPLGHTTHFNYIYGHFNTYEQQVFAKETIDPMGRILYQEHDTAGHLRIEMRKDAMGHVLQKREFVYDAVGNCIKRKEFVITPGETERLVTTIFCYDHANNLTDCTEAVGTPEQKHTRHIFNTHREKTCTVKPDGTELKYFYDGFGRLKEYKDSKDYFHYCYTYDLNSNVTQVQDLKQGTATLRQFDSNNRQVSEKLANDLVLLYTYDRMGRTTELTLPDQSNIKYNYNSLHLNTIQRGNYTHTYQKYNLSGILEKAQMIGQAGKIQYQVDPCQRLTKTQTPYFTEEIPEEGFDKCGNIVQKTFVDVLNVINEKFDYDSLNQLKMESGIADHTFSHDSLYNLVQKDQSKHQVNSLNQLLNDGNETHLYDLNGNLIQKGSLKLTYDALDRLIHVEKENEYVTYRYDELNRRLFSIHQTGTIQKTKRFIYQGLNEIGSCDEEGTVKELRVLGLGKGAEIGAAVLVELEGITYAPIHDRAGNVRALIHGDQGTIYETYRYSAYGEEQIFDSNNHLAFSINPWRFSSKRTDDETGFVYFGRRYYNPTTTRWVTADPLGFDAGPNLYAYVFNNPLTSFDLYGLRCRDEDSYSSQRHERVYASKELGNDESNHDSLRGESFREKISDIKSIVCGVGHGALDFLLGSAHDFQTSAAYIGFSETNIHEKISMVGSIEQAQSERMAALENSVTNLLAIDESNSTYHSLRSKTTMGLEIGSLVASGYGIIKGVMSVSKIARMSTQISRVSRNTSITKATKTNQIWTSTKERNSVQNAYLHWKKHGHDFAELSNAKQYVEGTKSFINHLSPETLTKVRFNGDIVFYNPSTNTFAISNAEGLPRTMYKPNLNRHPYSTNLEYFNAQR